MTRREVPTFWVLGTKRIRVGARYIRRNDGPPRRGRRGTVNRPPRAPGSEPKDGWIEYLADLLAAELLELQGRPPADPGGEREEEGGQHDGNRVVLVKDTVGNPVVKGTTGVSVPVVEEDVVENMTPARIPVVNEVKTGLQPGGEPDDGQPL